MGPWSRDAWETAVNEAKHARCEQREVNVAGILGGSQIRISAEGFKNAWHAGTPEGTPLPIPMGNQARKKKARGEMGAILELATGPVSVRVMSKIGVLYIALADPPPEGIPNLLVTAAHAVHLSYRYHTGRSTQKIELGTGAVFMSVRDSLPIFHLRDLGQEQ